MDGGNCTLKIDIFTRKSVQSRIISIVFGIFLFYDINVMCLPSYGLYSL